MFFKKGDISSIFLFAVLAFFLAIGGLFVYYISNEISSQTKEIITSSDILEDRPDVRSIVNDTLDSIPDKIIFALDYLFLALFIGLILSMMISAFFIQSHPIFFPIYFICWLFAIVIAAPLSNAWMEVSTHSTFVATITHFPIMRYIMDHLPWYVGIVGGIVLVLLFAKTKGESRVSEVY